MRPTEGNYPSALELYKKAIPLSPENARIYQNLANLYRKSGKPEVALTFIKKAATLAPNDHSILSSLEEIKELLLRKQSLQKKQKKR